MVERIRWLPKTILLCKGIKVQGECFPAFAFPAHRTEGMIDAAARPFDT
jgi:hypothetical protein